MTKKLFALFITFFSLVMLANVVNAQSQYVNKDVSSSGKDMITDGFTTTDNLLVTSVFPANITTKNFYASATIAEPDLIIENILFYDGYGKPHIEKTSAMVGEKLCPYAVVYNIGSATVPNIFYTVQALSLWPPEFVTTVGSPSADNNSVSKVLTSGEKIEVATACFTVSKSGTYKIGYEVNPYSVFTEADNSNNIKEISIVAGDSIPSTAPDLSLTTGITTLESELQYIAGTPLTFVGIIRNNSNTAITSPFDVAWKLDYSTSADPYSNVMFSESVSSLGAGLSKELRWTWGEQTSGHHIVSLHADYKNILEEKDEYNNSISTIFDVRTSDAPHLQILKAQDSPIGGIINKKQNKRLLLRFSLKASDSDVTINSIKPLLRWYVNGALGFYGNSIKDTWLQDESTGKIFEFDESMQTANGITLNASEAKFTITKGTSKTFSIVADVDIAYSGGEKFSTVIDKDSFKIEIANVYTPLVSGSVDSGEFIVTSLVDDAKDSENESAPKSNDALIIKSEQTTSVLSQKVIDMEKKLVEKVDKTLTNRVKGRILLQVENNGEAWYVDPNSENKFYMEDGLSAYNIMRALGLGITNNDLEVIPIGIQENVYTSQDTDGDKIPDKLEIAIGSNPNIKDSDGDGFDDRTEILNGYRPNNQEKYTFNNSLINRLKGRILLQVEKHGEAWYINPTDNKRYYLGDGNTAYNVMRFLSLGIKNDDLRKIQVGEFE